MVICGPNKFSLEDLLKEFIWDSPDVFHVELILIIPYSMWLSYFHGE